MKKLLALILVVAMLATLTVSVAATSTDVIESVVTSASIAVNVSKTETTSCTDKIYVVVDTTYTDAAITENTNYTWNPNTMKWDADTAVRTVTTLPTASIKVTNRSSVNVTASITWNSNIVYPTISYTTSEAPTATSYTTGVAVDTIVVAGDYSQTYDAANCKWVTFVPVFSEADLEAATITGYNGNIATLGTFTISITNP